MLLASYTCCHSKRGIVTLHQEKGIGQEGKGEEYGDGLSELIVHESEAFVECN